MGTSLHALATPVSHKTHIFTHPHTPCTSWTVMHTHDSKMSASMHHWLEHVDNICGHMYYECGMEGLMGSVVKWQYQSKMCTHFPKLAHLEIHGKGHKAKHVMNLHKPTRPHGHNNSYTCCDQRGSGPDEITSHEYGLGCYVNGG